MSWKSASLQTFWQLMMPIVTIRGGGKCRTFWQLTMPKVASEVREMLNILTTYDAQSDHRGAGNIEHFDNLRCPVTIEGREMLSILTTYDAQSRGGKCSWKGLTIFLLNSCHSLLNAISVYIVRHRLLFTNWVITLSHCQKYSWHTIVYCVRYNNALIWS